MPATTASRIASDCVVVVEIVSADSVTTDIRDKRAEYAHLNVDQQRMNLANLLRGVVSPAEYVTTLQTTPIKRFPTVSAPLRTDDSSAAEPIDPRSQMYVGV